MHQELYSPYMFCIAFYESEWSLLYLQDIGNMVINNKATQMNQRLKVASWCIRNRASLRTVNKEHW